MNDCYLNYKYEYELLTNYDIDEIIFPRFNFMDNLKKFELFDCAGEIQNFKLKYNLYNYGINLLNIFGRVNIACLMFKHVGLLQNGPELELFIKGINKVIENNTEAKVTYYGKKNDSSLTYGILRHNFYQANDVVKYYKINSCLKNSYIKNERVAVEFQRHLAVHIDSRYGKSIIHTNLTETLNHHSCDTFTHGLKYDAPLNYGFISHFRTSIDAFFQSYRTFPFAHVFSDVEYYLFLCNTLGKK